MKRDDFLIHSLKYACANKLSSFYETCFEHFLQKQKQKQTKKNGRGNKDANKFLSFSETCFEQLFFKKGNKDEN